ncbi:MAG: hypothetical protein IH625_11645 [Rhodobacteraceae bacterium]|jgi:hypothetical protein|nr:hypothetical protein [Paracoccaceae bacterium]
MNISRGFLVTGSLYLLVGIGFGMHMGASGDHSMAPVHAHINLLGFTLMTVFGLAYRLIPALTDGWMGKAHFWLHQIGALALLVGLALLISGRVAEASIGPVLMVSEILVALGALIWAANVWTKTA